MIPYAHHRDVATDRLQSPCAYMNTRRCVRGRLRLKFVTRARRRAAPIWRTGSMAEWYVRNDDDGDDVGPMAFDEVVARMRRRQHHPRHVDLWNERHDGVAGSPRRRRCWAAVRGSGCWATFGMPLAAVPPTARGWNPVAGHVQVEVGTWLVGLAIFFGLRLWTDHQFKPSAVSGWLGWGYVLQPGYSLAWRLSRLGEASVAMLLALLAQISWYFIADIARDRRARIAARASASGPGRMRQDAAIFVYELTPEVRGTETVPFQDWPPPDDYPIAPLVAHED